MLSTTFSTPDLEIPSLLCLPPPPPPVDMVLRPHPPLPPAPALVTLPPGPRIVPLLNASLRIVHSNAKFAGSHSLSAPTVPSTSAQSTTVSAHSRVSIVRPRSARRETCKLKILLFHLSLSKLHVLINSKLTMYRIFPCFFLYRNKHVRALHEKSRPFKCSECGSQFAFQDGLSRHISMVRNLCAALNILQPTDRH